MNALQIYFWAWYLPVTIVLPHNVSALFSSIGTLGTRGVDRNTSHRFGLQRERRSCEKMFFSRVTIETSLTPKTEHLSVLPETFISSCFRLYS